MTEDTSILRWNIEERIEHHMLMIFIPLLAVTGLPLFLPDYFGWITFILGGVEGTRIIHRFAAVVLGGTVIFHLFFHPIVRRKTEILPSLTDIKNMFSTWLHYLGISKTTPKIGFHDPSAKIIVYWLGGVVGIGLAGVTGIVLLIPQYFPELVHTWSLLGHDLALVILLFVVIMHLYMSIFLAPHRPLLLAMNIDGQVSLEYVKEHHPLWYEQLMKKSK